MGLLRVKWLVSGTLGIILLMKHDGFWFSVVVGAIVNAFGVKVLKRILRRPRPKDCTKIDPGMPSSHAHMLSYFSGFAALTTSTELGLVMFILSAIVSAERAYRGIHTIAQIGVGLITGYLGAYGWIHSSSIGHAQFMKWDEYLRINENWQAQIGILTCVFSGAALLSLTGRLISGRIEHDA